MATGVRAITPRAAALIDRVSSRIDAQLDRPIPFILATGVIIVGVGRAVGPVTLLFYATVAQVLPVFLLAVIFEGRFATLLQGGDHASRFYFRAVFALMLGGEAAALVAIAGVGDNVVVRGLVVTALGWSTLLLVLHASVGPARIGTPRISQLADSVRALSDTEHTPQEPRPSG